MIVVKQIDPPEEDYRDPFVLLSDGTIEMWIFADEFSNKVGDEFTSLLMSFNGEDALPQAKQEYAAYNRGTYPYSYDLYGRVDPNGILAVGEFRIDVDAEAFGDFKIGDFVHMSIDRIDSIEGVPGIKAED